MSPSQPRKHFECNGEIESETTGPFAENITGYRKANGITENGERVLLINIVPVVYGVNDVIYNNCEK